MTLLLLQKILIWCSNFKFELIYEVNYNVKIMILVTYTILNLLHR